MIPVTLETRHWVERAEDALRRGSERMAELYMRRALEDSPWGN